MVSREGHGGLALGVCMKLLRIVHALPEYVIEFRFDEPIAAATLSMTVAASSGAALEAAPDTGAASFSPEHAASSNTGSNARKRIF
jgi:hypothetical protein